MNESPLFLRLRTIAFNCVNLLSFVWVILYSVVLFLQWDRMAGSERALLALMLITNAITVVALLTLLLLKFQIWLDTARVCLLLIVQIGAAATFAHWAPRFHCEEQLGDQQGICDLISTYVLIASWIIPTLLIIYLCGLALRLYRHRSSQDAERSLDTDNEKGYSSSGDEVSSGRPSLLPIMTKMTTPMTVNFPPEVHSKPRYSVHTRRSAMSSYSRYSSPPATPHSLAAGGSARLSKRSPMMEFV